jgi:HSP20 family protein
MADQELTPKEKQEVADKEQTRPGRYFVPDTDIYEDAQGLHLAADMPGVDQSNVEVELDDNVLTLQGRVDLSGYEGVSPVYTEYNVGHYLRRFTLADASIFDRDAIKARMVNGVLEVEIPKSAKAKLRRIPVSAN